MVRVIVVCVLAIISIESFSQKSKPLTLFTVKEEAVSAEEFIYLYKKNHLAKEDFAPAKVQEYLDLFVNFKLKVREARARGIDTTAAFLKEYASYKEELKKPYLPEGKLIDSLVRVTYERLKEEVKVSHILFTLKPDASPADTLAVYTKAAEVKVRALAGEDFAFLAALYSEEPMAGTTKGNLGYFTALQMVYPFENASYTAKKGDVVGPVRTQFGYHVLKVEDRKPSRGEVEVSHIMIRAGAGTDHAKAKNLVFEVYDQLKGGVSWDELCKQYSEDTGSKNNGGKLRPFGVQAMASAPQFEQAAFALQNPGDFSDPIQTQYGWHIVKLERKIPLPTLEELTPTLRGRVARDERAQVSRQKLTQKLRRDFSFKENEPVKQKTFGLADSTLMKGKWRVPGYSFGSEELFSLSSKKVQVQDFIRYVKENQRGNSMAPSKYMDQLYQAFIEKKINEELEKQIVKKHPEFEMLLREYYEGILLFDVMEKEVWKKASDDSIGQQKFYEANKEKYTTEERGIIIVYSSGSQESINALKKYVEESDTASIQKMIRLKQVRKESGLFQKQDRPVFSQIEWKEGLHSAENNRIYYLVQIASMIPSGTLTFEEARVVVISDYQDSLEKDFLNGLRNKYPVKLNEKAKKYVVEKLKP